MEGYRCRLGVGQGKYGNCHFGSVDSLNEDPQFELDLRESGSPRETRQRWSCDSECEFCESVRVLLGNVCKNVFKAELVFTAGVKKIAVVTVNGHKPQILCDIH